VLKGVKVTYEVFIVIVLINAVATLSLWRKVAGKSNRGPKLNKKAAIALWRSDPIVPKHDPPDVVRGQFSSLADKADRQFFADFKAFADVVNRWLAKEYIASRFRLQDLPDLDRSINVDFSHGPVLGRCFAIYFNQTRVGRLEISPSYEYSAALPNVYTSVEIDWARFFGLFELTEFLEAIVWHVTDGNRKGDEYRDARSSINAALIGTLWDNYRVSELDDADDQHWGELTLSFQGTASCYVHCRGAPARASSR
jgi:hypothetical protein